MGLDYLSLTRGTATLSGGEAQRIRLASQIGSGLVGVLYVLDEPSIGLHQRDNKRLLETLVRLRDLGNTVIVVEHDEETIRSADHVVDIGPGAGEHGGRHRLQRRRRRACCTVPESVTGQYLTGKRTIPVPDRRRLGSGEQLVVRGAREHNLHGIDVAFPLGCLVAVTGVSGSGKSTLVNDILLSSLLAQVHRARTTPGLHRTIDGVKFIDKVVAIDQSPIGRTPRSNAATYTGLFDHVRKLFSQTSEAKVRGYLPGRFSFNVRGGRCEGVRRGRDDQDRDALPARRLRALRGVRRGALQPGDTRGDVQGQDDRRRPRHVVRGGPGASSPTSPPSPAICRPSSTSVSATSVWANRPPPCRAARPSG